MDKALNYLALARKAGRVELGEEPVGAAARAGHAWLVLVAADASEHTWRRARSFVAESEQQCLRVPFSKDELGQAIGRMDLALAAFTDPALALAFAEALGQPEKHQGVLTMLRERTEKTHRLQQEAKAHQRNKRMGKPRRGAGMKN